VSVRWRSGACGIAFAVLALETGAVGTAVEASLDASWSPALEALAKGNYEDAIALLKRVVATDPANAEVHNRLGFAYRKQGRLDAAFVHYREALRLAPRHLGAHEYIGEAYLLAGNVDKAREHLAVLEQLCGRDCDEYRDLQAAIAARR
jgi:Flp pilus assembly protein TadD